MPEGHTIHRLARDLKPLLVGRPLGASSPQGRFDDGAAVLDGRVLRRIEPYGKHLFFDFEGGVLVHVHLGLYGKFTVQRHVDAPPAPPRGAVRLRLDTGAVTVDLNGPTDCSLVTRADRRAILARLGPDPIRPNADGTAALARIARSRAPIGTLLLDQAVIAGVGNVFRAEALFVTGINPHRAGLDLAGVEADALWTTITAMLRQGVRDGRIVTVDPAEVGFPSRRRVPRGEATYVYKRAHCLRCGSPISTVTLAARTCYFCAVDQPLPASP